MLFWNLDFFRKFEKFLPCIEQINLLFFIFRHMILLSWLFELCFEKFFNVEYEIVLLWLRLCVNFHFVNWKHNEKIKSQNRIRTRAIRNSWSIWIWIKTKTNKNFVVVVNWSKKFYFHCENWIWQKHHISNRVFDVWYIENDIDHHVF